VEKEQRCDRWYDVVQLHHPATTTADNGGSFTVVLSNWSEVWAAALHVTVRWLRSAIDHHAASKPDRDGGQTATSPCGYGTAP